MSEAEEKEKRDAEGVEGAAEDSSVICTKAEWDDLQKRLSELEGMRDRLQRSAADFENAKKRLLRERDEFVKFSQENILRDLLPVLDNFERALSHAGDDLTGSAKGVIAGIQMVFKQLAEILKNQGLKRLQPVGEKFDPHQHEAIGFVPAPDKEDIVIDEAEPGYMLHERLLRAAKVRVGVAPEKKADEEKQDEIT